MPAGYSGTPLAKKLGIKEGARVGTARAPSHLEELLAPLPIAARLVSSGKDLEVTLLFARTRTELKRELPRAKAAMAQTGALWLCWPKKTSDLARDLTGNDVRESGLAAGLVDIKVCAIDEDWSGLKFVYRVSDRKKATKKK